ncbi:MAG: NTP/NDP exchange transporter [Candidatus Protochlamydia sp.]|nr:NTP/NDP exchange transporter [Candidatus Protochlamydia sp.]
MKNQEISSHFSLSPLKRRLFILFQFFLIIFVYHTLKDLKDSLVITASDAGAEVIPFIKIWAMLPAAIAASYFFSKLYQRLGREKTLYFFIALLLGTYIAFAFVLFPFRESLHPGHFSDYLKLHLPEGAKGFVAMISFWYFTVFYLAAELWSVLILSILFWSFVNETTTLDEAKNFYPLCMFTGNFAGIASGQFSHFLCHHLVDHFSWQTTLQLLIIMVSICGMAIMWLNRQLSKEAPLTPITKTKKASNTFSFKDQLMSIFSNKKLLCISLLVVGFGLTTNLIEVVWKEKVKYLHPTPKAYNAYINQLTSLIGIFAVCTAFCSRWIFRKLNWTQSAMLTPFALFITSLLFFASLLISHESLSSLSSSLGITPIHLIVTLGSIYYVIAMTAKYTLFDTSKEMAFLSIDLAERTKAKSVIDSIGSRLGKSGASCFYQFLLVTFGAASGHVSIIGIICLCVIAISMAATKKLGSHLSGQEDLEERATQLT